MSANPQQTIQDLQQEIASLTQQLADAKHDSSLKDLTIAQAGQDLQDEKNARAAEVANIRRSHAGELVKASEAASKREVALQQQISDEASKRAALCKAQANEKVGVNPTVRKTLFWAPLCVVTIVMMFCYTDAIAINKQLRQEQERVLRLEVSLEKAHESMVTELRRQLPKE